ncbi:MAG: hypothetical protein RI571_06485 [Roseovarius sp.]|nr:hypothetical protein [Roseovarius sp.]
MDRQLKFILVGAGGLVFLNFALSSLYHLPHTESGYIIAAAIGAFFGYKAAD